MNYTNSTREPKATMKRPRTSIGALSLFALALSSRPRLAVGASLRATQSPDLEGEQGGGGGDGGGGDERAPLHRPPPTQEKKKRNRLIAKLSTSPHPRAVSSVGNRGDALAGDGGASEDAAAPEIPLIGVGVGNLPHNKIPYILASALSLPSDKNKKKTKIPPEAAAATMEVGLNYRLIDTSHGWDSALETLVGRSLGRLSSPPPPGGSIAVNNKESAAAAAEIENDYVYHVVIKIWHTHLGHERTMLSVQDSLSDILPTKGTAPNDGLDGGSKNAAALAGGRNANNHHPNVRVHAVLQYPRCYDSLFASHAYRTSPNFPKKYDSCRAEEDSLDDATKAAGPSPLLDRDNAWKRSYRALEELYHRGTLESVGVSNFGPADLDELFDLATVGPHVYQGSLRMLLTQDVMVEEMVRHGVHYQCYDAASTVLAGREGAPRAYARLERIGAMHGGLTTGGDDGGDSDADAAGEVYGYSPVQVVLGWLVHHRGVGVVPGTTDARHLAENSPSSLGGMPGFTPREALDVETAVLALVNGEDLADDRGDVAMSGDRRPWADGSATAAEEEVIDADGSVHHRDGITGAGGPPSGGGIEPGVVATFFNTLPSGRTVRVFRIHPDTGEQVQLSRGIPPGRSGRVMANREDVLVAYDGHGVAVRKFLVEGTSGSVDFTVE